MNSYLSQFSAPENVSFSTGGLIKIVIGMIPHSFVTIMVNAGIKPREMGYDELINHIVNLESTITTSKPDEPNTNKKVKFDKDSKSGDKKNSKDKEQPGSNSKNK